MQVDRVIRWVLTLGVLLLAIVILGVVLYLTESFLSVWDRLNAAPRWLFYSYLAALAAFFLATVWLAWKLLAPRRSPKLAKREAQPTEEGLAERVTAADDAGVEVAAVRSELSKLEQRRGHTDAYIAFFGEISSGKSSLIKSLLSIDDEGDDDVDIVVSVRGGSTRAVQEYRSEHYAGWVFADVPGINESDATLDEIATDEARRAHVVVYVCDGDLTRTDYEQLQVLLDKQKPTVIALNKSDLLNREELSAVVAKIRQRLEGLSREHHSQQSKLRTPNSLHVVAVSAATVQKIVKLLPDGSELQEERVVTAQIDGLTRALTALISHDPTKLQKLRDNAVFALASAKLDLAEDEYRQKEAHAMVQRYTKKAVIGALAAVAPGTDLLIQGVLATALIKEMSSLYNAPVRDLDIQRFLSEVQQHVGKAVPVILAVAGNVLKAFPGIGTVAGGFTHAVAYGLIFDALGKSLAITLDDGHGFDSKQATSKFKESLESDLEARTKRIIKLAFAARKGAKKSDTTSASGRAE